MPSVCRSRSLLLNTLGGGGSKGSSKFSWQDEACKRHKIAQECPGYCGTDAHCSRARRTWKAPFLTSLKERMAAPSSTRLWLLGGMDPGVMPPTSAWWPRDATKNTILPSLKTGVMTVMSGRWDPPASWGWLEASTSPGCSPSSLPSPSGPQCLI